MCSSKNIVNVGTFLREILIRALVHAVPMGTVKILVQISHPYALDEFDTASDQLVANFFLRNFSEIH